jgi:WD40 repeat protein
MTYRCAATSCPVASSGAVFPTSIACPMCGQALTAMESARTPEPTLLSDIGARLPTLLALPLAGVTDEPAPALALWAACDAVEIALKLCLMAGAAEHGEVLPNGLVRALRDRVEMPTLGRWRDMALAAAQYAPTDSVIPLRETVNALVKLLGSGGDAVEVGLLPLRNRLAHGGPLSRGEAMRLLGVWTPKIQTWAESLQWLEAASLVAVGSDGKRYLLRGKEGEELSSPLPVPNSAPSGSTWLCVGDRALSLGPLGAYDLHHGALQVYVRRAEVQLQYLRLGDDGGLCDSSTAALELFRRIFLPPLPDAADRRLAVQDFTVEIRREAARRIGREDELSTLIAAARAIDGQAIWVSGPAGIGKSNLLAALMEELLDHPSPNTLALPYRFRAGDRRCGRSPFLAYVRERLLPSEALDSKGQPDDQKDLNVSDKGDRSPSDNEHAQEVRALFAQISADWKVVLVLDGVDEVAEHDPGFVDDLLLWTRGTRVHVVAAGRPERGVPQAFLRAGAVEPFPKGLPPLREQDVRALLLERTGPVRKRLLARDRERGSQVHNNFIERVVELSAGLAIYVNYVVGDLNSGRISPEHPEALPASLHAYHDELLRRAAVGDLQAVTTPLLVLLALAHEPLTASVAAALLVRRGVIVDAGASLVERALWQVEPMLRRVPTDHPDVDAYTVAHHTIRTHVLESPSLRQTVAATRAGLADAALRPGGDLSDAYLYVNGVRHLLEAERHTDAVKVLTDFDLTMERFRRLDTSERTADDWYADWERTRGAVGPLDGRARVWWHFARTNRHRINRSGWEHWRVLFQAAMNHADDSVVTAAAEAYEAAGKRDWTWLRWINRPARWRESALVAVLVGHEDGVSGAGLLPDGRLLSLSYDGTLRLWTSTTGTLLGVLESPSVPFSGVHILSEGRLLLWSSDALCIWTLADSTLVASFELERQAFVSEPDDSDASDLSWSSFSGSAPRDDALVEEGIQGAAPLPNGNVLFWSDDGTLSAWDPAKGEITVVFRGHTLAVADVEVLADGRVLSWSYDGTLRLWNGETGATLSIFKGHSGSVDGAFLLGTERLLSWSERDCTIRIWNMNGEPTALQRQAHLAGVTLLDDGRILSWSYGDTLHLREPENANSVAHLSGNAASSLDLGLARVGKLLSGSDWYLTTLSGGRVLTKLGTASLRLWNPHAGEPTILAGHTATVHGAAALPDGRIISWSEDCTLRLWSGSGTLVGVYETPAPVTGATVLPDGKVLTWSGDLSVLWMWSLELPSPVSSPEANPLRMTGASFLSDGRVATYDPEAMIYLSDPLTAASVKLLQGHSAAVREILPLPGGRLLSWSNDHTLRLWDGGTGAPLAVLRAHTDIVLGARLLPSGRLVSWSRDETLRLWEAETGEFVSSLEGHTIVVQGATSTPDGRIVSWSGDGTLRIWVADTGECVAVLEGHSTGVAGATVTHDGAVLSWAWDDTVRLWDAGTGKCCAVLGVGGVRGAIPLPDDRILAWSVNGSLSLWNIANGKQLGVMKGEPMSVENVVALQDDRALAILRDGTVAVWDLATVTCVGLLATPRDWSGADSLVVAAAVRERARHHLLEPPKIVEAQGDVVAVLARGQLEVFQFMC